MFLVPLMTGTDPLYHCTVPLVFKYSMPATPLLELKGMIKFDWLAGGDGDLNHPDHPMKLVDAFEDAMFCGEDAPTDEPKPSDLRQPPPYRPAVASHTR